mgnify:CR=1 FL=1
MGKQGKREGGTEVGNTGYVRGPVGEAPGDRIPAALRRVVRIGAGGMLQVQHIPRVCGVRVVTRVALPWGHGTPLPAAQCAHAT